MGDADISELTELTNKVFSQHLLRDQILDHAIRYSDSEIDHETLCAARLVNPTWTESITRILRKRKVPLFNISLNENNSVYGSNSVDQYGKLLDNFVDAMMTHESLPTFSLKLQDEFFREENLSSLSRCWTHCTSGLVELELNIPPRGASLPLLLPRASFPSLHTLSVCLLNSPLFYDNDEEEMGTINLTHFLHSLLSGSESLTKILFHSESDDSRGMPPSFKHLRLPSTLQWLQFRCSITSAELEGHLVGKGFPNLTYLEMLVPNDDSFQDGLFYKVFDNLKSSLVTFKVPGDLYEDPPREVSYLRFPVMEKLTTISIQSTNLELEHGLPPLETLLPNLRNLKLINQTSVMIGKWMENSKFSGVRKLKVHRVNENFPLQEWSNFTLSLGVMRMQQLRTTFPNVRILDLTIPQTQTSAAGLRCLFREMKQLTSLSLRVIGSTTRKNSDFWDSLLIGAPVEVVRDLRESPCPGLDWDNSYRNVERLPALNDLQSLKVFSIRTIGECPRRIQLKRSLISDLPFKFAFLRMQNLRELYLGGRFMASRKMIDEWRHMGGMFAVVLPKFTEIPIEYYMRVI